MREQLGPLLHARADGGEVGRLGVPDGDHEVAAEEHVQLAELHLLAVVHVAGRAQHREERGAVTLGLGALVGLHRVLHRELVQVELLGERLQLLDRGPVEADPRHRLGPLVELAERVGERGGRGDAAAVDVDAVVDEARAARARPLRRILPLGPRPRRAGRMPAEGRDAPGDHGLEARADAVLGHDGHGTRRR